MRKRPALVVTLMIAGFAWTMVSAAHAVDTTPARLPVAQATGNGAAAGTGASNDKTNIPDPNKPCIWPIAQPALPDADAHAAMAILPSTRWQPIGGDVQFELTGMAKPLDSVSVYFTWSDPKHRLPIYCLPSLHVRLLPRVPDDDGQTYRYAARIPALSTGSYFRIVGSDHWDVSASTVPLADMYVDGITTDTVKDVRFTAIVGITTRWVAMVTAVVSVVAVWGLLAFWVRTRRIPGGAVLGIISTPNGVASLSQFQILIWTFVIGGGVVYVMMLSGNLIDIPASTLGLLGITGFALVGSKLKANADGSPQRISAPGAVTSLTVVGSPTANTVVLSWAAPAGADQPLGYTIQMQLGGTGMWESVAHDIAGPPYAVIGLTQNTAYQFQVFATNPAGAGPATVPVTATTAAVAPPGNAAGILAQVTNLIATAQDSRILLSWATPAPAPDAYTVQYRPAGTLPWATYSTTANTPFVMLGLNSGTDYEFQVFGTLRGVAGTPSALATAKTWPRLPRWSDLVMSGDVGTEADLSRLQMLVFTSITAVFTGLTLINTGVIPDLPVGELALVGISNGVYLASKVSNRGGQ